MSEVRIELRLTRWSLWTAYQSTSGSNSSIPKEMKAFPDDSMIDGSTAREPGVERETLGSPNLIWPERELNACCECDARNYLLIKVDCLCLYSRIIIITLLLLFFSDYILIIIKSGYLNPRLVIGHNYWRHSSIAMTNLRRRDHAWPVETDLWTLRKVRIEIQVFTPGKVKLVMKVIMITYD